MPERSAAVANLPSAAEAALRQLGSDLATARKRRAQSLKDWAARVNVSVSTLMRMERGDPGVSAGVYATALWLINRHGAWGEAADPKEDSIALESEIQRAKQRHRPRGVARG